MQSNGKPRKNARECANLWSDGGSTRKIPLMTQAKWVKGNRLQRGWSQYQLADLARLSREGIGMIERGKSTASDLTLSKLANVFGVAYPTIVVPRELPIEHEPRARWYDENPEAFARAITAVMQLGTKAVRLLDREMRSQSEKKGPGPPRRRGKS